MVRIVSSLLLALLLIATLSTANILAANGARGISFYTDFTSIGISQGEDITLYVNISNMGEIAEDIDLDISTPEGWEAVITSNSAGSAQVHSVHLEPESDAKRLTFKCTPASDVAEGEYTITLAATSSDQQIQQSIDLTIVVMTDEGAQVGPASVELSVNYPSLEDEPGKVLEYRVQVTNNSAEELTYDFAADIPQNFQVGFSPSTDRNKNIASLKIGGDSSEGIIVRVTPGLVVEEGKYQVKFSASSGDITDTIVFEAVVTGSHHMRMGTTREVLSAKVTAGKEVQIPLVLLNDGTAPLQDIEFSAPVLPEGWEVEFKPESVAYLQTGGDFATVDMIVKPKSKAIAGDYLVVVRAREGQSPNADLEFRITVETSDSWLWIAVIVVVVILAVLLGIFLWLRRR
ncbi:MAG: hypothetical protein HQ553_07590 [Chloroflexi bacterium]|nr:hypothetical protein [Chloroflexota bacterium]